MRLANNTSADAGGELVFHSKAAELAALDALTPELREILNYGPINQTAVALLAASIRFGAERTAEMMREAIRANFPGWRPDLRSPQLGL